MEANLEVLDGSFCAQGLPNDNEGKPAWQQCRFVRKEGEAVKCAVFRAPLKEMAYADTPMYNKCAECHAACREAERANE